MSYHGISNRFRFFMWNKYTVHEIEHENPELADKCSNLPLMSAVNTEQLIKTTNSNNFSGKKVGGPLDNI